MRARFTLVFFFVLALCPLCLCGEVPDPLPIKRVLIAPDRVAAELDRAAQKRWAQLPAAEFEEQVRAAARGVEATKNPPRLVEARYGARLAETALEGWAQWQVHNPQAGPALLPLPSLNLALRSQPNFENGRALLGELDGKSLSLLAEKEGDHPVSFDWSARGESRPPGLEFDLEVPVAPVATLELNLPEDRVVTVSSDGCVLQGPLPAEAANHRKWTVGFAGRSQVHLTIRKTGPDQPPPLLLATLQSRQDLTPDGLQAEYEFAVKVQQPSAPELRLEYERSLRPFDVSVAGLKTWRLEEPADGNAPGVLVAGLREPFAGGPVLVRCLAPAGQPGKPSPWASPWMRLLGAVPRGETVTLRVHRDVQLEGWRPGDFALVSSKAEAGGSQVLTLAGGGVESDGGLRRPGGRVLTQAAEYRARQLLWWQVAPPRPGPAGPRDAEPRHSSLTALVSYEAINGRLFALPLGLPAGWDVDRVQVSPADLLRTYDVRQENGKPTLFVELQRPLAPAGLKAPADARPAIPTLRLTVQLRPAKDAERWADAGARKDGLGRTMTLPLPDLVPVGAKAREGGLAVEFDEGLYDGRVRTAAAAGPPEEDGPWGKQAPDYYYPFRGQPPQGTLTLQPSRPRLRARCTTEVVFTAGRAAFVARLALQPVVGAPEAVDVTVSAPGAGRWAWKTVEGANGVQAFERHPAAEAAGRLAALAAGDPLGAALLAAPAPAGERWRLTLNRPLSEPLTLEASWELPVAAEAEGGPATVEVPLPAVSGAEHAEGEVRLSAAGARLVQVTWSGLREPQAAQPPAGRVSPSPWRVFRYGQPPLALAVTFAPDPSAAAADRAPAAVIDQVRLVTTAGTEGRLVSSFRFRARQWPQRTLPVRLPEGATPLAVRVDGRTLTQLPPPPPDGDARSLELPAPAGPGHRYEVTYEARRPAWRAWALLESPAPGLPVAPADFRRTWLVPAGVVPVPDGGVQRLPGPGGPSGWMPRSLAADPRELLWPADGDSFAGADERRQLLLTAAGKLADPVPATLGEALDRLAFDLPQDRWAVVVDAEALRDAGLGPDTPLPSPPAAPFWEGLGLVPVPFPTAAVLTTRRQEGAWRAADAGTESLEAAVAEAVRNGHDRSGRFRDVADWLSPGTACGHAAADAEGAADPGPLAAAGPGWAAWEPAAGDTGDGLWVVRTAAVPWLGVALAVLAALAFFLIAFGGRRAAERSPADRPSACRPVGGRPTDVRLTRRGWRPLAALLVWLGLAGLGCLWLPAALRELAWWPLVTAAAIALGGLAAFLTRPGPRPDGKGRPPATGSSVKRPGGSSIARVAPGLLILALGLLPALVAAPPAGAPDPVTVYVVPGPADAPEKQTVLAPPELLEQLQALAARGSAAVRGPVLLGAEYRGEVAGGFAHFKAEFQVHAAGKDPGSLVLPLAGVELEEEPLVGGARVKPVALAAPQAGYRIPIPAENPRVVSVSFRVPVGPNGDDREVAFGVPRLPHNRLELTAPEGARYLRALVKQGAASTDGAGRTLKADLGQVTGPLLFRWREESGPTQPAVTVKELYLWELGASASNLTALLRYGVVRGAVTSLVVELPDQTEVQNVETAGTGPEGPRPRLREWRVVTEGAQRRAVFDLAGPVTSGVQLRLDLVRRQPFGLHTVLPLPVPLGASPGEGLLAYRADGLRAEPGGESLGIKRIEPDEFVKAWKEERGAEPAAPAYACVFGRRPGPPALGVRLELLRPRVEATQDLAWRAGPQFVDLKAGLRLTAPDGDLAVVDWEVPAGVTVVRVAGPDVRSWNRTSSRVQVWLQRSVAATELQLVGWWPAPKPAGDRGDAAEYPFELPRLGMSTANLTTYLRLTAAPGLAAEPEALANVWPWPSPAGGDLDYVVRRPDYGGRFVVRPATALADVRVLTVAEVRDRQLTFTAHVDLQVRQGELRTLPVRLRNWDGPAAVTEKPAGAQVRDGRRGPGGPAWDVDFQAAAAGRVRLTLSGALPLEEVGGEAQLPEVVLGELDRDAAGGAGLRVRQSERWVWVAGQDLAGEEAQGLAAADVKAVQRAWPEETDRLKGAGAAWRVTGKDWGLRLAPRQRADVPAPVRVFLAEHAAAVPDGRGWLHEACYRLYHAAGADLRVRLPAGAAVRGVTVDGSVVTPLVAEPGTLWVPLPGGAGPCCVRLRWAFAAAAEPLDRPRLDLPHLEGASEGPVVWGVHVPAGYVSDTRAGTTAAAADAVRAEAALKAAEAVADRARARGEDPGRPFAEAEAAFGRQLRRARHRLAAAPDDGVAERLKGLEERNRQLPAAGPEAHGGPDKPDEDDGPAEELGARGTPLYWQTEGGGRPPEVGLTAESARQDRLAVALTVLLAAGLVVTWQLAQLPRALAWVRALWPELLMLLALVGGLAFGANLVVVATAAAGLGARLVLLAARVGAWLVRPAPAPAAPGSTGSAR
jgi:hypothetical protein